MIKVAIKMSEFVLQLWCKNEALIIPSITYDNKTTRITNLDRIIWRKSQFFQRYKNISDHFLLQSTIVYLCWQPANRSCTLWVKMERDGGDSKEMNCWSDYRARIKSQVILRLVWNPARLFPWRKMTLPWRGLRLWALLWQQPRQTPGGFQSGQTENVAGLLPGCSVQDVIVRNTVDRFLDPQLHI